MKPPSTLARLIADFREIFRGQVPRWADDGRTLPRMHKFAHFCVLLARNFLRNRCPVRASALAYTTLLALVPLLAVAISVSSLFLTEERSRRIVDDSIGYFVEQVSPQLGLIPKGADNVDKRTEAAHKITEFINGLQTGALGITGTLGLIFVAISLLVTIEAAFNDIWGVERGRSWLARVEHYWAAITLGPFLLLAAALIVGAQFQAVQSSAQSLGWPGELALKFVPLAVIGLAFTLFYQTMPNTQVRWQASLVGGLVAGVLWNLNGQFNLFFASRIVTTSKLYGSLSAIPVLLIGLYFSWLILLFGAQVAYAFQNLEAYLQERASENVNQRGREFIAFRLLAAIGVRFQHARPPASLNRLADELSIPTRLVHQVLQTLLGARLVVPVAGREPAFAPARPLDQITCHDILQAMRASYGHELATREEPARKEIYGEFQRILDAERAAADAVTLLQLVNRTPQLAPAAPAALPEASRSEPA